MVKNKKPEDEDLWTINDDPSNPSKHHRKLASHGGGDHKENISSVPLFKHRAWHVLYKALEVPDIILLFKEDYEVRGTDSIKSPLMKKLHEGWANNTDEKIKRTKAWNTLFENKTLEEIVEEINTIWLDTDYEIRIGMIRVKAIQLSTKVIPKKKKFYPRHQL